MLPDIDPKSLFAASGEEALPVWLVAGGEEGMQGLSGEAAAWAEAAGFRAETGAFLPVPAAGGGLSGALFGLGKAGEGDPLRAGKLARLLPKGRWRLAEATGSAPERGGDHALAFGLASYRFERYRKKAGAGRSEEGRPVLVLPDGVDADRLIRILAGCYLARDLINTPANDMGPDALEAAFRALGERCGAEVSVIGGDDLLARNFPMIHAVGRASAEAPRLLDMRWGRRGAPKVTLVGKGVTFDTGGLDIKPAAGMLLMKKDMGGAANVMGLALMVMEAGLDIDLRVLVPAVENAISGTAFRPGDILRSRLGLTVEIGNTDAEGRLVLADALALACENEPELLIDMATLTGAARVALGPDLPPYYTGDEALAGEIAAGAEAGHDPLWRMPLHEGYDADLASKIGDLNNAPSGGFAGSITAALFLRRFAGGAKSWAHLDIYGWNPKEKPHAPVGGEAQGIRALYTVLEKRYGG